MNTKKLLLSALTGTMVMLILSGIFHMVIMKDYYTEQMKVISGRPEPFMHGIVISYVILSLLMAYIYPIGYKGGSVYKEGFVFGALAGILCRFPLALVMWANINITIEWVCTEAVWHMIEEGIGGIAIAVVYGKGGKKG